MNNVQIQNLQLSEVCKRVATKLRLESEKSLPALKKNAEILKKSFLESKDVFKKAKTEWHNSSEYLDFAAKRSKIKQVPLFEKALSHIKLLKKIFDNRRTNKLRLLYSTIDELAENPDSLVAKVLEAKKNKLAAFEALKHANGKKNKTLAETILSARLEKIPDTTVVKRNVTQNIADLTAEKAKKDSSCFRIETKLQSSQWALDLNKAKKIADRGRRTFLQFIKRIPKDVALEENKSRWLEAERRYKLSPESKAIDNLKANISELTKKLKRENLVKKYSDNILDRVDYETRSVFAQESPKITNGIVS